MHDRVAACPSVALAAGDQRHCVSAPFNGSDRGAVGADGAHTGLVPIISVDLVNGEERGNPVADECSSSSSLAVSSTARTDGSASSDTDVISRAADAGAGERRVSAGSCSPATARRSAAQEPAQQDGSRVRHGARQRTLLTPVQRTALEDAFRCNYSPNSHERESLADSLGLSARVVQVWFQNRRAKSRRDGAPTSAAMEPPPPALVAAADGDPRSAPAGPPAPAPGRFAWQLTGAPQDSAATAPCPTVGPTDGGHMGRGPFAVPLPAPWPCPVLLVPSAAASQAPSPATMWLPYPIPGSGSTPCMPAPQRSPGRRHARSQPQQQPSVAWMAPDAYPLRPMPMRLLPGPYPMPAHAYTTPSLLGHAMNPVPMVWAHATLPGTAGAADGPAGAPRPP